MKLQKVTLVLLTWFLLAAGMGSCAPGVSPTSAPKLREAVARSFAKPLATYAYTIVNRWPHDSTAFTEGLIFINGSIYESNGLNGSSDLRIFDLNTGSIKAKVVLGAEYFAEGMTILNGKVFQLTWSNNKGFIYDPESLAALGEFAYQGEGWGLTNDGRSLIMSNGSNEITFLDPETFKIQKVIQVYDQGAPLHRINELEYIKGKIYANIWYTDKIAQIDPASGEILGWIDLTGLRPEETQQNGEAVLNGIAYDPITDRLFVTGKLWPTLFEIKLVRE